MKIELSLPLSQVLPSTLKTFYIKLPYNPSIENLTINSMISLALPTSSEKRSFLQNYGDLIKFKISWLAHKNLISYFTSDH